MSECDAIFLGVCLTHAPAETGIAIFGFAEFLAALALLILVFSSSDFLYQFRVSVAPVPLLNISFAATVIIGAGSLLTDVWFAERWLSLPWGISRASIQSMFGALFLSTVLLWIWFAFARPPVFGRWNYKRYYSAIFRAIVRGSDAQLSVIAAELARSAEALVRLSNDRVYRDARSTVPGVGHFAHDTLLLLSNVKLCRHVIASSPVTAIAIMREAANQERYNIPLGGFIRSITQEAIVNRDSILYHEDECSGDVLGDVQPFSKTLYGNYRLIQGIAGPLEAPLDLNFRFAWDMDGTQFEAYCRITLLAFKNCVELGQYRAGLSPFHREFGIIGHAGMDLYKLDGVTADQSNGTAERRLSVAVRFVNDMINFLDGQKNLSFGPFRARQSDAAYSPTVFDDIAGLMFELMLSASNVRSPSGTAWRIQYNSFWGRLFPLGRDSLARKIIHAKFARLVFDQIKELETFPNFQASRVLGLCLNVFGLDEATRGSGRPGEYALNKAVIRWTKRNYLRLSKVHPPVAKECLSGDITFEPRYRRLVKTFAQGLRLEPSRRYLKLDRPPKGRDVRARIRPKHN